MKISAVLFYKILSIKDLKLPEEILASILRILPSLSSSFVIKTSKARISVFPWTLSTRETQMVISRKKSFGQMNPRGVL